MAAPHPISASHGITYRPEIDGLRALAVLPVILFHAGFKAFGGGYIGVDIFFVISGFLITSIIQKDLVAGRFSIAKFYERRARRILPALFTVLAVCLPFAWLIMMPSQLEGFAKSLMAVPLFASNIYFMMSANYFDQTADEKPLLHTWSLGVEEQFYIVFPIYLMLVYRFGFKKTLYGTAALLAASFITSELTWRSGDVENNFFLAPSRAWELLAGSLCALLLTQDGFKERFSSKVKQAFSLCGLIFILVPVFVFTKETPTPSYYMLLPILGAVFIILFANPDNWAGKILSNKIPVFIGLVSYSAYLWHQPIFAFVRVQTGESVPDALAFALIGATFAMAFVTWRYIERPFRDTNFLTQKTILLLSLAGSLLFIAVGGVIVLNKGFMERIPQQDRIFAAHFDMEKTGNYVRENYNKLQMDFDPASSKKKLLIIGDSFAQDFLNMVNENRKFKDYEIRTLYIPSRCQIYIGAKPLSDFIDEADLKVCARGKKLEDKKDQIEQADVIILVASWREWAAQRLPETIAAMNINPKQKILVVGRKSFGSINLRKLMSVPLSERNAYTNPSKKEHTAANNIMRDNLDPDIFINMQKILCGMDDGCRVFTPSGDLISHDGSHLTREGAIYAGSVLFKDKHFNGIK